MKRIFTVMLALAVFAGAANAQQKENARSQKMAEELGLSTDQKEQIKKIHEAEKKEVDALKADTTLSKKQAIEARKAVHEKYKEQMKNVLTPEQKKKAAAHHAGEAKPHQGKDRKKDDIKKEEAKRHAPGHDAGQDRDNLKDLDLTADQKAAIAKNRETFKAEADAIKSNESLSKEEKQSAFRKLAEKQRESMKAILTEEQERKLAERMKDSKAKGKRK